MKTSSQVMRLALVVMLWVCALCILGSTSQAYAVERTKVEINSNEDFITLWNTEIPRSAGVDGDWHRYGVHNTDVVLNTDISISSDDIYAQVRRSL